MGGLTFFWTHCIYSIMKTEDTEALRKQRAKPSKSINLYELLVPLCSVHHYNSIQYCNTETVFFFNIPFLQINITSQMWPSGGKVLQNHKA